jgi:predicted dehydrogenase
VSSLFFHDTIPLSRWRLFASGKHVFCEKTIDHDLGKIQEVMDALKGTGVKYQVGFQRRSP